MTISEFLLARITEDEAIAQAALDARKRPRAADGSATWTVSNGKMGILDGGGSPSVARGAEGVMEHIARHDPARVLAECEAKRRIMKEVCEEVTVWGELTPSLRPYSTDGERVLMALAAVYASHPDYQQEWTL